MTSYNAVCVCDKYADLWSMQPSQKEIHSSSLSNLPFPNRLLTFSKFCPILLPMNSMDLPFSLQLYDLCSLWTNHSLFPALQLHDLPSSQQTIPSSFRFSSNLPVGFPPFSSCPPLSVYNYQVELYRLRCLVIPHENTMPRWLPIALEIKTNDVFNTHSTSLASTFSLPSLPIPDGHCAVFWFF